MNRLDLLDRCSDIDPRLVGEFGESILDSLEVLEKFDYYNRYWVARQLVFRPDLFELFSEYVYYFDNVLDGFTGELTTSKDVLVTCAENNAFEFIWFEFGDKLAETGICLRGLTAEDNWVKGDQWFINFMKFKNSVKDLRKLSDDDWDVIKATHGFFGVPLRFDFESCCRCKDEKLAELIISANWTEAFEPDYNTFVSRVLGTDAWIGKFSDRVVKYLIRYNANSTFVKAVVDAGATDSSFVLSNQFLGNFNLNVSDGWKCPAIFLVEESADLRCLMDSEESLITALTTKIPAEFIKAGIVDERLTKYSPNLLYWLSQHDLDYYCKKFDCDASVCIKMLSLMCYWDPISLQYKDFVIKNSITIPLKSGGLEQLLCSYPFYILRNVKDLFLADDAHISRVIELLESDVFGKADRKFSDTDELSKKLFFARIKDYLSGGSGIWRSDFWGVSDFTFLERLEASFTFIDKDSSLIEQCNVILNFLDGNVTRSNNGFVRLAWNQDGNLVATGTIGQCEEPCEYEMDSSQFVESGALVPLNFKNSELEGVY